MADIYKSTQENEIAPFWVNFHAPVFQHRMQYPTISHLLSIKQILSRARDPSVYYIAVIIVYLTLI